MTRSITDRQLKYLNALLSETLGRSGRKIYLQEEYDVDSSKDLTLEEASEIISKFVKDNPTRDINIDEAERIVAEASGQDKMFDL